MPYKGAVDSLNDAMTGRVQFTFSPVLVAAGQVKAGKVLALAVSTAKRSPMFPGPADRRGSRDCRGSSTTSGTGCSPSAKTPRPLINLANQEVVRVLNLPDIKERMLTQGATPTPDHAGGVRRVHPFGGEAVREGTDRRGREDQLARPREPIRRLPLHEDELSANRFQRDDMSNIRKTRRDFIKQGGVVGAAAIAAPGLVADALANRHPHPRPTSLPYLDRNMYRRNTDVLAISPGHHRGNKMQMMAVGDRRYLFQWAMSIDVSDPLKPTLVARKGFLGGQLQLAYNQKLGKWILMTGRGSCATFSNPSGRTASTTTRC